MCTRGTVHGPGCTLAKQRLMRWKVPPLSRPPTLKLTFPGSASRVQAILSALAQLDLANRTTHVLVR
ncbi:hypothetical protein SCLCIDRAFT_404028 [Scleroderma citrinum Foug A]|uniref:Uncharacterized protein n=1 Tax=Scleroderma citrinum Foug A TaxID=1036808 RepID=A0A0C3CZI8_9AGAM|nr:hypothetical protein SCLCIDRAFT_404028 [Scleroderma citrinum Foug A]